MESVSIGVWIRAGGRYENEKNSGISHLLEHLLFKGTKRRSMKEMKEAIEGRGGTFNGFTSEEFTCYLVKLLAKDADLGVDILSDMVLSPKLDPNEIEKEKNVVIEEINMYKDMPSHYVHELLAEIMWKDQPLGMPLAGSVETVRSITREDLVKYKESFYSPKNMLLIGVGKIAPDRLVSLADKYISAPGPSEAPAFKKVTIKQKAPELLVHNKDTEQTHVAIGLHSLDRFHPDKYTLSLVNIILGANMSSRLFHIVRDEMALCYEISSSVRKYEDSGALVISAGVDQKKLSRAIEVVMKELKRMTSEPVTMDELRRAKEYYRGQLLFALEDTMSNMLWLGEKIIAGEEEFSVKKMLERVEKTSQADIMRVAGEIFKSSNLNMAVIGPVKDRKGLEEVFRL